MARTVEDAFLVFLNWLTPRASSRMGVSMLREATFDHLSKKFDVSQMLEIGSLAQGTDIQTFSGGDYLVRLRGRRPMSPEPIVRSFERSLATLYPNAEVQHDRPALLVTVSDGRRIGLIPAFAVDAIGGAARVSIPGPGGGWVSADPRAYRDWFQQCNNAEGVRGAAQGLVRLAKAWKYYREIPVSSFYLELRAARFMAARTSVVYSYDVPDFFRSLHEDELAAVEDPTTSRHLVHPCARPDHLTRTLDETALAASRTERALSRQRQGDTADAFDQWSQLFAGQFPAYY